MYFVLHNFFLQIFYFKEYGCDICLLKLVFLFIIYNVNMHGNVAFSLVYIKVTFLSVIHWSGWQFVCPHSLEWVTNLFFCHPLEQVTTCLSSHSGAGDTLFDYFLSPSAVTTGSVLKVLKNIFWLTAKLITMSFFTFKLTLFYL